METTRRKHQGSEGSGLNRPNRALAEVARGDQTPPGAGGGGGTHFGIEGGDSGWTD